jgi:Cupin-like domain
MQVSHEASRDQGINGSSAVGTIANQASEDRAELPWIGLRLIAGEEPDKLAQSLIERGFGMAAAELLIAEAARQPLIAQCLMRARHARKLSSLVQSHAKQLRQSPVAEKIPVETLPTPERFFENYYFANRPVVVRGLMQDWPALALWTPEYFADRFGEETIEVTADRESDPKFEDRFPEHRHRITMRQFVEKITTIKGNDLYLVAKNRLLDRESFISLRKDVTYPHMFLTSGPGADPPRIWIGGAGTITPLHHDASNIFFGQIYGRKLVRLIPPSEIENLYNDRTCFSDIDLDQVDYVRFPRFRRVTVVQAIVHPGEFLLLPLGWWHQVRSLDVSISLSFQNFAVPGGPVIWDHYSI